MTEHLILGKSSEQYGDIEETEGGYLFHGTETTYLVLTGTGTALGRGRPLPPTGSR